MARILVVDDEPALALMFTRLLAADGHAVETAADAEQGARLLGAGEYELVLLDVVLPGKTGLEALGEYRRLTRAPIVLMSGQGSDARADALALGADGYLQKPVEAEELGAAVRAALSRPRSP